MAWLLADCSDPFKQAAMRFLGQPFALFAAAADQFDLTVRVFNKLKD